MLTDVDSILRTIIEIKRTTESIPEAGMPEAMRKLELEVKKLEDLGCVLKDVNQGLVDFPAVRLGKRVWLCWKLGESSVEFWHGLQDGFAGRQRVKEEEFYSDDLAIKSMSGGEVSPKTQT
jgi:hypothetical protein